MTTLWGALQLLWTVLLLFAHFSQIARAVTTYEAIRSNTQAGPVLTAVATGTVSMEDANVAPPDSGLGAPGAPGHGHSHKKKGGCLSSWSKLFGLDTFVTIAFNGYQGSKNGDGSARRGRRRPNPFYRGILRNCEDFWLDGPIFARKESGSALVGGEKVDYTNLYDVPRGGMGYRRGYEAVPAAEEGEA